MVSKNIINVEFYEGSGVSRITNQDLDGSVFSSANSLSKLEMRYDRLSEIGSKNFKDGYLKSLAYRRLWHICNIKGMTDKFSNSIHERPFLRDGIKVILHLVGDEDNGRDIEKDLDRFIDVCAEKKVDIYLQCYSEKENSKIGEIHPTLVNGKRLSEGCGCFRKITKAQQDMIENNGRAISFTAENVYKIGPDNRPTVRQNVKTAYYNIEKSKEVKRREDNSKDLDFEFSSIVMVVNNENNISVDVEYSKTDIEELKHGNYKIKADKIKYLIMKTIIKELEKNDVEDANKIENYPEKELID